MNTTVEFSAITVDSTSMLALALLVVTSYAIIWGIRKAMSLAKA